MPAKLKAPKTLRGLKAPAATPGSVLKRLERLQTGRLKGAETYARNLQFAEAVKRREANASAKIELDQIIGNMPVVRANHPHRFLELQARSQMLRRLLSLPEAPLPRAPQRPHFPRGPAPFTDTTDG